MFEIFKYNIFSSSVLMQIFPYSMTLDLPVTQSLIKITSQLNVGGGGGCWVGLGQDFWCWVSGFWFLFFYFWFQFSHFWFLVLVSVVSGFWFQFSDASSLTYVFIFHISKNYPTSGIWLLNSNFSFRKIRVQFFQCLVFWLLKFTNKFDLQAYCFSFWE